MNNQDQNKVTREFGLTSLSVNNRTSVIILTFIIAILGITSYISMPKESFPEVVFPTIYVGTPYPGNSPVDMENLITRPIEKEIKGITGVDNVTSTSIQDYSTIIVEFTPEVDLSKALQDVKDAVDQAKSELPTDLDEDPSVFEINLQDLPIMYINISGDYSNDELEEYAEYLQDEIEALRETQEANISGLLEREIQVNANPYEMEARRVSFSDIQNAIAAENVTISGGNIKAKEFRRSLRVAGEFTDAAQIEDVIVKTEDGNIVYVRDVATVADTYEERSSYARMNENPVVTLGVVKRRGENLIAASDKIKEIVAQAQENRFPSDLEVLITNDQSKATKSQLNNLENSIISGVILVVLVLMFFLNLRNALFVGIAIPLSMFMSFMVLNFLGITINMMVLFSLILALGMLVDNGIVVVENIYRLMQEGYSPIRAAKEGVGEVALPIITSTATTLAAFLPLAFWGGLIGEFMRYLPITLIIVLSCSLFVALVVNPVLAAMYMKLETSVTNRKKKRLMIISGVLAAIAVTFYVFQAFTMGNILMLIALLIPINLYVFTPAIKWFQLHFLTWLEKYYTKTISFSLRGRNPYFVFFGTVLLLFFSIGLVIVKQPLVEFFPSNEPNYINIFIEKPIGSDIEATNELTLKIEKKLSEVLQPYDSIVEAVITQVGENASDPNAGVSSGNTPNKARINVSFVDYEYRNDISTVKVMDDVRSMVSQFPGAEITVDKDQNGPPVGKPINIEVNGEEYDKLIALANQIQNQIEQANIPGIEELKKDLETGKPELLIDIDRDKARRFGLSTSTIATELRTALFGVEISKLKEGEDDYPIQLRLDERYRYDVDALVNQKISFQDKKGNNRQVPISSVADIEYSSTYGSVRRKDMDRVITLSSNVLQGYNATEINQSIQDVVQNMDIPAGYEVSFTGEQQEQEESSQFLFNALLIAVMLIFFIIVSQFNSVMTPFIIMTSVVLSTIGVFLGLVVFDMNFVIIMTGIGIISLAGVVVNNAIVLIDYTNLIRERRRSELGVADDEILPYHEILNSIVDGGRVRLRPVLLTAITTVLGLIPLAIGLNINFFTLFSDFDAQIYYGGPNADFWGPMAWTVIFGLTFATFLTLVVVPVMYLLVDKIKLRAFDKRKVAKVSYSKQ
ncbi:efflux RND transporter permease subunit [Catalinimonas niigatensis]|uniref:efflux RND transporter permease subunit n=1 Tax=Catalinimonas niigatensis TaxID=1397264 RepID=UPI0026660AFC|nr:efflux RND transporter permease subunit [Catalinimonas niigatensis]WPP49910.1 efflux RND transporter permease subunit [Catalinimonas niigatensis]